MSTASQTSIGTTTTPPPSPVNEPSSPAAKEPAQRSRHNSRLVTVETLPAPGGKLGGRRGACYAPARPRQGQPLLAPRAQDNNGVSADRRQRTPLLALQPLLHLGQ